MAHTTPQQVRDDGDAISVVSKQVSEVSPPKAPAPIGKKRKVKLGAFMTGSSNNSSRKGSSEQEANNFFSFKEPA